ncbi:MAG TPA: hypothetical protein VF092_18435 [Longimicrobium sp.]
MSEERQAAALAFFVGLVRHDAGYLVRGQRGWAHHEDVQLGTRVYRCSEVCDTLLGRRMLVRELASSPPHAAVPVYVYRVTEKGMAAHAESTGAALPLLPPLGPADPGRPIYAPTGARWVLDSLRDAVTTGAGRGRIPNECGWLTAVEIRKPLDTWNERYGRPGRFRTFDDATIAAMVNAGLVERQHVRVDWGRERPLVVYRATEFGRAAPLLEWSGPECDETAPGKELLRALASCGRALVLGSLSA